jgi:hypothetical protein
MRINFYGILMLIAIPACTPEPVNPNIDCSQAPPSCTGATFYYESGVSNHFSPIYNPNNSNEFMYIRKKFSSGLNYTMTLEKYNISNGVNTVIMDSSMTVNNKFITFNWGQTGWIVFGGLPQIQIYKIREDGLNFAQLTTAGFSNYPNFNFDGSKIFFSNSTDIYRGLLMDINTNLVLDSIIETPTGTSYNGSAPISPNKFLCFNWDDSIHIVSQNLTLQSKFYPAFDFGSSTSAYSYARTNLTDTNNMYLLIYEGIYKINFITFQASKIIESCIKNKVRNFSISPDGNHILYELERQDWADPCHLKYSSEIHIMNIDGSNDHVLNLP